MMYTHSGKFGAHFRTTTRIWTPDLARAGYINAYYSYIYDWKQFIVDMFLVFFRLKSPQIYRSVQILGRWVVFVGVSWWVKSRPFFSIGCAPKAYHLNFMIKTATQSCGEKAPNPNIGENGNPIARRNPSDPILNAAPERCPETRKPYSNLFR